jgi:hypothetical protein
MPNESRPIGGSSEAYVETTYYRDDKLATLSAYFDRGHGHGHELAAQALGTAWHRLGNIYEL